MNDKINYYINQDINNPKYLFHGSPLKLEKIVPKQAKDSNGNSNNIAKAVFIFSSFLKSTPYAFMKTIIAQSKGLDWDFDIPNSNTFPLMTMCNVNIDEDIKGYIYVFKKSDIMIKDEKSYQYKCFEEIYPYDVVEICYKDFSEYYEVQNNTKSL